MVAKQYGTVIEPEEFHLYLKEKIGSASIQHFADWLGVSRQMVYMLLDGQRHPGKEMLAKLGLKNVYVADAEKSKGTK